VKNLGGALSERRGGGAGLAQTEQGTREMAGDDGFVITMEGGGSAGDAGGEQKPAPADLLPIDLHYDKLIDWLVDRKKVPDDWRKRLKALNAKVKAAMSAPPASQAEDGGKEDEEAAAERRKAESILQTG